MKRFIIMSLLFCIPLCASTDPKKTGFINKQKMLIAVGGVGGMVLIGAVLYYFFVYDDMVDDSLLGGVGDYEIDDFYRDSDIKLRELSENGLLGYIRNIENLKYNRRCKMIKPWGHPFSWGAITYSNLEGKKNLLRVQRTLEYSPQDKIFNLQYDVNDSCEIISSSENETFFFAVMYRDTSDIPKNEGPYLGYCDEDSKVRFISYKQFKRNKNPKLWLHHEKIEQSIKNN